MVLHFAGLRLQRMRFVYALYSMRRTTDLHCVNGLDAVTVVQGTTWSVASLFVAMFDVHEG